MLEGNADSFVSASHYNGFKFIGWRVEGTTLSGDNINVMLGQVDTDALYYTSKLSHVSDSSECIAPGHYTATAVYQTERTISYVTTTINQTDTTNPENEFNDITTTYTFNSTDQVAYEKTIELSITKAAGYKLLGYNLITYNASNEKTSEKVEPTATSINTLDYPSIFNVGQNVIIEAVFTKTATISIRIAVDDTNDKNSIDSFGLDANKLAFNTSITNDWNDVAVTNSFINSNTLKTRL